MLQLVELDENDLRTVIDAHSGKGQSLEWREPYSSEGRSVVDAAMVINIINIRTNTIRTIAVLPRIFGICLMVC